MHLVGVLVRYDRDDLPDAPLRIVEPGIVLPATPDDHRQLGAGPERLANVAHGGARHREEHRPEAGEGEVVGAAEVVGLHVRHEERRVGDLRQLRLLRSAALTKFAAQSTPTAPPRGPTCLAMNRVLSPNPHPTSSTRAPSGGGCLAKRLAGVRRQTVDQQVLEATELVEQNRVPRRDGDVVCLRSWDVLVPRQPTKPRRRCVPSQKGLVAEPPQRQRYRSWLLHVRPSAPDTVSGPAHFRGPFGVGVIVSRPISAGSAVPVSAGSTPASSKADTGVGSVAIGLVRRLAAATEHDARIVVRRGSRIEREIAGNDVGTIGPHIDGRCAHGHGRNLLPQTGRAPQGILHPRR